MLFRPRAILALSVLLPLSAFAQAPVQVAPVSESDIVREVSITGTVSSPQSALLSTAVAGLVESVAVDEGRRVSAGDALLQLDSELAALALERALAEVRQQQTALDDARRRLADAEKVVATSGISRSQVESIRSEVAGDEASLIASQAAAREQRAIVERHTLKAPFDGVISGRFADPGEWVNPGDGLLGLVATDNLRFDFRLGQEHFARLTPDTPVVMSLDALPDESIVGRIDAIVPIKSADSRTFLVRVLAAEPKTAEAANVTPGMSVRATLQISSGRRGITVPRDAVLRFPDGRVKVWVIDEQAEVTAVREQTVQLGLEFGGDFEVKSGLKAGDRVVVRGNESLTKGQAVTILKGTN